MSKSELAHKDRKESAKRLWAYTHKVQCKVCKRSDGTGRGSEEFPYCRKHLGTLSVQTVYKILLDGQKRCVVKRMGQHCLEQKPKKQEVIKSIRAFTKCALDMTDYKMNLKKWASRKWSDYPVSAFKNIGTASAS